MITTLVQIKLSETLSLSKAQEIFATTAPKYLEIQGLIRKYYLLSEDGETAGGVYLWESRKAAEMLYTEEWKKFILQKYGSEPSVTYFYTPVIVDNLLGEIIKDGKR
jgi:Putative mono-oxygenase ydhR